MTAREAILKVVADKFRVTTARLCTVTEVSEETRTCEVVTFDTEVELLGVRLQADEGNGMLLIPKVGSMVIVVEIARFEYAVVLYSAVEKITMLDGSFGGLIKISPLVEKLNAIENMVNKIVEDFNAHSHPGNGSPPSVPMTGTLKKTEKTELENSLITHGNV
jgi:hypothetical protein